MLATGWNCTDAGGPAKSWAHGWLTVEVTIAAVVLAAGAGTRFDDAGHKLLARFGASTVVGSAVDAALAADLDETIVVIGAAAIEADIPAGCTIIVNRRWQDGIATSLRVACDLAGRRGHTAIVVGLGDQPMVGSTVWRTVADAPDAPVAVATYEGSRRNPVRLDQSVWHLLPASGDEGARHLMRLRPELVREVPCVGEPADIDTVEDLAKWS